MKNEISFSIEKEYKIIRVPEKPFINIYSKVNGEFIKIDSQKEIEVINSLHNLMSDAKE